MKRQGISLQGDNDLRALFEGLGMSRQTIERAIKVRKQEPQELELPAKSEAPSRRLPKGRPPRACSTK